MTKPLTRAQKLGNTAFLAALERTGNIRLAAREIGIAPSTLHHRRARHPVFAARWAAALAAAQARFAAAGGCRGPATRKADAPTDPATGAPVATSHRTRGGEAVVVRRRDGKLQLRAAQPGKLTRQCEQAFLAALSATANVRLSAAAAGASVAAFYRRRRRNPAFRREMRLALETGYEQLEGALLAGRAIDAHEDDGWRHNDPPPIPAMTASEAIQLLHLHHKTARLWAEHPYMQRKRGETQDQHAARLALLWTAKQEREAEDAAIRCAAAAEASARDRAEAERHAPAAPTLPALDQVAGWSRASGKPAHHEGVALFGGWRVEDL